MTLSENSERWSKSAVNALHHHPLSHKLCHISILACHDPSCVLVFWPETVAPPEVQLVLALISFVSHTHRLQESYCTVHCILYIVHYSYWRQVHNILLYISWVVVAFSITCICTLPVNTSGLDFGLICWIDVIDCCSYSHFTYMGFRLFIENCK